MLPGILDLPTLPTPPTPYTAAQGSASTANASQSTSTGYTPVGFEVTAPQTVQDQILKITAKDSPLMQQARTKADQYVNSRGLLHSSLAVQAGQEGVLSTALPIAQQDASTYNKAMTDTQNAKNAALHFGANAENTSNLANAQLGTQVSQSNAQLGTQTSLANAEAANKALADAFQVNANYGLAGLDVALKVGLANLDTQTKMAITTMDNQYRQLLQTNQDAASMFNQVAQNISAIAQNSTLSKEAKNAATQTQLTMMNQALKQQQEVATTEANAVGSLNLGSFFLGNIATAPGTGPSIGNAKPIPGTNPLTAQWDDGVIHPPPAKGMAVEVSGLGWWAHDGKFYPTQAEAINMKRVTPSSTPGTTPPAANPADTFNDTVGNANAWTQGSKTMPPGTGSVWLDRATGKYYTDRTLLSSTSAKQILKVR